MNFRGIDDFQTRVDIVHYLKTLTWDNKACRPQFGFSPWVLTVVGNEGMRALYIPFKGLCRAALVPLFPTKNQPVFELPCVGLVLARRDLRVNPINP